MNSKQRSRILAKNIFRKVFDKFRVNKFKLRLRQALKNSFKNIQSKLLICRYDKFQKRLRSKLRQICWNAAETIIEKNFGQFPGKIVGLHSTNFENVLKVFRDTNFDLRLRQASEKSFKNIQAKLLICSYDKFPKRLRSKLRQNCWKAAGTIIEKYFGQFRGKNFELLHACFENVLKLLETIILTSIWDNLRKRLSITPRQ